MARSSFAQQGLTFRLALAALAAIVIWAAVFGLVK
jgi:hypothetical protein